MVSLKNRDLVGLALIQCILGNTAEFKCVEYNLRFLRSIAMADDTWNCIIWIMMFSENLWMEMFKFSGLSFLVLAKAAVI